MDDRTARAVEAYERDEREKCPHGEVWRSQCPACVMEDDDGCPND
jgi:hypothetical protein